MDSYCTTMGLNGFTVSVRHRPKPIVCPPPAPAYIMHLSLPTKPSSRGLYTLILNKIAFIFIFKNPKLFSPENFSISHLVAMMLICKMCLVSQQSAPLVVNLTRKMEQITTITKPTSSSK